MLEEVRFSMLIIDDEPIIADGLEILLMEEFGGIIDLYKTYTVAKAQEIFESILPDIVLTDIKMPTMSGLELASHFRILREDVRILFLTGLDDFAYANAAIKQDAQDYILKMEGDDTILCAIQKTIDELRSEKELDEQYRKARTQLERLKPVFRQQLFFDIATGLVEQQDTLDSRLIELQSDQPFEIPVLLILGRDTSSPLAETQRQSILLAVESMLASRLAIQESRVFSACSREDYLWGICTEEATYSDTLSTLLLDIQNAVRKSTGISISFAISADLVPWSRLPEQYHKLRRMIWHLIYRDDEGVIHETYFQKSSIVPEEEDFVQRAGFIRERVKIMETYLEKGQQYYFEKNFDEICIILASAKRHSLQALEIYYAVLNVMLSFINRNGLLGAMLRHVSLTPLYDPASFTNWEEGVSYLRELAEKIHTAGKQTSKASMESTTAQIKQFIMEHLHENLSLSILGQASGFNAAYLSRIFKQYEGIGANEYITKCRMEHAANLLKNTTLKIYEISEQCGYNNVGYFNKAFKGCYSKTPQEFRQNNP